MGTRNLTMVIRKQKPVIAQYGQWDGYPSGQGSKVLEFLKTADLEKFEKKLDNVRFMNEEDEKQMKIFLKSIDAEDGWMNDEQADKYYKAYPYMSRNICAIILDLVYESNREVLLNDQTEFAEDSLFCEWAYVIDLDKKVLECYKGFNKRPLGKTQRFKYLEKPNSEYYPVRCVKKYKFSKLPELEKFINDLDPNTED